MHDTAQPNGQTCAAGVDCVEYDKRTKRAAYVYDNPLCADCLRVGERNIRSLTYDYIDLEQLHVPSLSQALDSQSQYGQRGELPALVREHVDVLQRKIWWVTTTWAEVLTGLDRLADPPVKTRDGYAVRWAVALLTPRVARLAKVGPVELVDYPEIRSDPKPRNGEPDPPPSTMSYAAYGATVYKSQIRCRLDGVAAVGHLSALHQVARSTLGRTRRTHTVPGTCSNCGQDTLRRDEPRYGPRYTGDPGDPCPVYCHQCGTEWTSAEYARYVEMLVWPGRDAA